MHQTGILDYAVHKSKRMTRNPCLINTKSQAKEKKSEPILLKLRDFAGAFFILGTGLSLAILTLVGEHAAKKIMQQ